MNTDASTVLSQPKLTNLRQWNIGLTVLHAVQAALILLLSSDFAITITSTFPQGPPGSRPPISDDFFDLPIGPAVAIFLGLAALDHLLTATIFRGKYERDLASGINRFRWIEYSLSATLMVVLIASFTGITDIAAIVAIVGANVAMILFGWLQERLNPPERDSTTMLAFWFGTVAGLAPWVAILINVMGSETVPGFVYGIVIAEFIFFFSFGLNQWLQYRKVGRWVDYLFGEKAYLVLSLGAKSVLAWQIYGGSLAG